MGESVLPEAVQTLLRTHINTHESLEVLLLLQEHRGVMWTAEAVSERVRLQAVVCQQALQALETAKLVLRVADPATVSYVFAPHDSTLRQTVEALSRSYSEQ